MSKWLDAPQRNTSVPKIVREVSILTQNEVKSQPMLGAAETMIKTSDRSSGGRGVFPHGLSFLSLSAVPGGYPDTGESGDTYDVEVNSLGKSAPSESFDKRAL